MSSESSFQPVIAHTTAYSMTATSAIASSAVYANFTARVSRRVYDSDVAFVADCQRSLGWTQMRGMHGVSGHALACMWLVHGLAQPGRCSARTSQLV